MGVKARGGVRERITRRNSEAGETPMRRRVTGAEGRVQGDHFRLMDQPESARKIDVDP